MLLTQRPAPYIGDDALNKTFSLPNPWGDPGKFKVEKLKGQHPAANAGMEKSVSLPSLNGKFRPQKDVGAPKFGYKDSRDWTAETGRYLGGRCKNARLRTVMRQRDCISPDLSWLWYRMRRDPHHPLRERSMKLPSTSVTSGLRDSGAFEFW